MKRLGAAALLAAIWSSCAYAHFDGVPLQPCDNKPPASAEQPLTVPVSIMDVPGAQMFIRCHKQTADMVIYGCTFLPDPQHEAVVLINSDMTADEQKCTLVYEKAHLPPNNWLDKVMEARAPGIVAWTPPTSIRAMMVSTPVPPASR